MTTRWHPLLEEPWCPVWSLRPLSPYPPPPCLHTQAGPPTATSRFSDAAGVALGACRTFPLTPTARWGSAPDSRLLCTSGSPHTWSRSLFYPEDRLPRSFSQLIRVWYGLCSGRPHRDWASQDVTAAQEGQGRWGEMAPWLLTSSIHRLCGDFTWRHLKALCLRVPG